MSAYDTKGTRRKKDVNDEFIDNLYADMTALYHLDQIETSSGVRADLGPLPAASKALIISFICVWLVILICAAGSVIKKKSRKH